MNTTTRPAPLDRISERLYPFESHFLDRGGLRYHYLDEGQGEPVVMVHGNPTWSFYYRDLVKRLSPEFHCIVPDHMGCGCSDKPDDSRYDYTLKSRVDDLEALLDAVIPGEEVNLVLHDWGGMIGMAWAARHVDKIKRLVLLNTAAFHLPETRRFHWQLRAARDMKVGDFLVRRFNAFSRTAAQVCCKRKKLSAEVKNAYCAPYDTWENRIATSRFVQDIPLQESDRSYAIVSHTQETLAKFKDTPTLICWGELDFVFDDHFLKVWEKTLPQAEVHRFSDCGHYILEDADTEVLPLISDFLTRT